MGATQTKATNVSNTNVINNAYQSCGSLAINENITMNNVDIDPAPQCGADSDVTITQNAGIDSTCLLAALQKGTADLAASMDNTTKAGLGYASSDTNNEINTKIESNIEQSCANQSETQMADFNNTKIRSCHFRLVQNATLKSSCQINAHQDEIAKIQEAQKNVAEGMNLMDFLKTYSIVIGFVVVIIVIGIVIFATSDNGGKVIEIAGQNLSKIPPGIGGRGKYNISNYIILFIILLYLLISFVLYKKKVKKSRTGLKKGKEVNFDNIKIEPFIENSEKV